MYTLPGALVGVTKLKNKPHGVSSAFYLLSSTPVGTMFEVVELGIIKTWFFHLQMDQIR